MTDSSGCAGPTKSPVNDFRMKLKNHLFVEFFLLLTVVLVPISYFLFQKFHKSKDREPASYSLNTAEIESRSKKMMEEGRRLHVIEDYKSATKVLSELLNTYPYTGYMEEASFLLAKGLFYEEQYNRSEAVIGRLREYDPTSRSKWFGYALLVMGKIHEQRGEKDKSIHLYRKVVTDFSDKDLVNEAEDILIQVSL